MADNDTDRLWKELRNIADRLIVIETKLEGKKDDDQSHNTWRENMEKRTRLMEKFVSEQATWNKILGIVGGAALTGIVLLAIKSVYGG